MRVCVREREPYVTSFGIVRLVASYPCNTKSLVVCRVVLHLGLLLVQFFLFDLRKWKKAKRHSHIHRQHSHTHTHIGQSLIAMVVVLLLPNERKICRSDLTRLYNMCARPISTILYEWIRIFVCFSLSLSLSLSSFVVRCPFCSIIRSRFVSIIYSVHIIGWQESRVRIKQPKKKFIIIMCVCVRCAQAELVRTEQGRARRRERGRERYLWIFIDDLFFFFFIFVSLLFIRNDK